MLIFVGLGLFDEKDVTLKGLEAIKNADIVYLEAYTSRLTGTDIKVMEKLYERKINVLFREDVEINTDWLSDALDKNVVFMTGGDTMTSTTHIDLRLRAAEMGIETKLIHGPSIISAVYGLSGLQNYKFGKSASIPFPYTSSRGVRVVTETPYDTILLNKKSGLHTLVFLDIDPEKGYMTAKDGLKLLMEVENKKSAENAEDAGTFENIVGNSIAIGIARAGSEKPCVYADFARNFEKFELGGPLQILVIAGELHLEEAKALVTFANAPVEILDE